MDERLAFAGTNGDEVPISYGVSWFGVSWDACVRVVLCAAILIGTGSPVARLVATAGERISVIVRSWTARDAVLSAWCARWAARSTSPFL